MKDEPEEDIVAAIKRALTLAESGSMRGVAIVWCDSRGECGIDVQIGDGAYLLSLLGATVMAVDMVKDHQEPGD